MKVLLVSANREKINMPTFPLGLACVAQAAVEGGHEVEWVDLMTEIDIEAALNRAVEEFRPGLIGVSIRNVDDQNMANPRFLLKQARDAVAFCRKASDVPIVLGGAGYSMFPESALKYVGADMGIQGEGEIAFPLLLDGLEKGRLPEDLPGLCLPESGLQAERSFAETLEGLPLPHPRLFETSAYEEEEDFWMPVQTRRGCPLRCSYCSTETIEGHALRRRSPDAVVRWLGQWVEAGIGRFQFVDNTFNLPPSYAKALCSRIQEAPFRMSWRCIIYPGSLREDLVKAMAKAGCKEVSLGLESGSDGILKEMNKRYNSLDAREAARMLMDQGIQTMGFLMLGGPGETRDSVEESLDFIEALNLSALKITQGIRIYPHTRLARIAAEEGVISEGDDLLFPRFYMAQGLEEWLRKTVQERKGERRNWFC